MREMLFRGKRVNSGEWVEGGIIPLDTDSGYVFIAEPYLSASTLPVYDIVKRHMHLVYPESVGQWTGMYDRNGKKIFEGDIVKTEKFNTPNKRYVIKYDLLLGAFIGEDDGTMYFTTFDGDSELFEVIGNIHEHADLLEG